MVSVASGPPADILAVHAQAQPSKKVIVCAGREVTFLELNSRANRVANGVAGLGLAAGDRAAVMAYNSVAGYEVSAGLRKAGLIGVPVNFRLRGPEVAYILNDSGAAVVFAGPEFVPVVEEARAAVQGERRYVAVDAGEVPPGWLRYEDLLAASSEQEPEGAGGGLGASMIYTSGTTGRPKGAFRAQGVGLELALQSIQIFGLDPSDKHLVAGPGYHSAVSYFSMLTVLLGGTVVVMPRFDPEQALRLIAERRCTTTFMAPVLLQRILDLPEQVRARYDVSSMRALILGGAPFPFSLKERAVRYFPDALYEFYGSTESGAVTFANSEDALKKRGTVGKVAPGAELRFVGDDGKPVPQGQIGEIYSRIADNPDFTYHNKPEKRVEIELDGFITSGDVGYIDQDGYVFICDRKRDMVISGGVNIYPAEIEAALHALPGVHDCAVFGIPDDEFGEALMAVVEPQAGVTLDAAGIRAHLKTALADYKVPKHVEILKNLPREDSGKIFKRRLRDPYWERAGRRI